MEMSEKNCIKHGWYWDWNEVNYIEIPHGIESLDIDTEEEEFDMARLLWESEESSQQIRRLLIL